MIQMQTPTRTLSQGNLVDFIIISLMHRGVNVLLHGGKQKNKSSPLLQHLLDILWES
jgi:hypothetical protein